MSLPSHGGNVHKIARSQGRPSNRVLDFSASINPLGLSPTVRRAIQQAIALAVHYPEIDVLPLQQQLAKIHKIPEACLVIGNGSAELISVLPRALGTRHGLVIGPTFMEFERALTLAEAHCTYVHATPNAGYAPPIDAVCMMLNRQAKTKRNKNSDNTVPVDTVFFCHPNSPTGQVISRAEFRRLLNSVQKAGARIIVDEAFIDYCASRSVLKHVRTFKGLFVLRSFTKFFAIPGLRIGYLGGPVSAVNTIRSLLPPWSVNTLASAAAEAALKDKGYQRQSVTFMNLERKRFRACLQHIPHVQRVYSSSANFLLVQLTAPCQVSLLVQELCEQGLLIRDCENFAGIDVPTIRLAVRRPQENDRLLKALKRGLLKWS
ncbi:MAG: threonine-phosphate decarboxylase [Nitrospirales bacterium]|nr:MAG: threonine-phosphate decarboxylase [Nitrospirales bacterium]